MAKYEFGKLLAPPFTNDAGQSVGIALSTFHTRLGGRVEFDFPGAFIGSVATDAQLQAALDADRSDILDVGEWDPETFVDDVLAGPVVWFDGASEAGPRALGHRSLLADPTSPRSKVELNRIKQRQWWRPVAPIVLENATAEWFEDASPSPYMLRTFVIREHQRGRVPAVSHLDTSARVQTLRREDDERLFIAVSAFARRTGVPMLCNTSLNDRGEPIVESPAQGIAFALQKFISIGYFLGRRVVFRDTPSAAAAAVPARTLSPFDLPTLEQFCDVAQTINPHGLDPTSLYVYLTTPALRSSCDIRNATDVQAIRASISRVFAADASIRERIERYLCRIWTKQRPPCANFDQHEWSGLLRASAELDPFARPPF